MALHEKGRSSMKKKDYAKALVYFLDADEEFRYVYLFTVGKTVFAHPKNKHFLLRKKNKNYKKMFDSTLIVKKYKHANF